MLSVITPGRFREFHGVWGIEPRLGICKANTFTVLPSLYRIISLSISFFLEKRKMQHIKDNIAEQSYPHFPKQLVAKLVCAPQWSGSRPHIPYPFTPSFLWNCQWSAHLLESRCELPSRENRQEIPLLFIAVSFWEWYISPCSKWGNWDQNMGWHSLVLPNNH